MWPTSAQPLFATSRRLDLKRLWRRLRRRGGGLRVACVALLSLAALCALVSLLRARTPPSLCASPAPLVCAHGGETTDGRSLANTAPAYRAALANAAVTCIEVDVSRTRDSTLVALHTRQLLQISDGEFDAVGDAQLEALRWYGNQKGEHATVLTLHEALAALVGRGLKAIILDVKDGPPLGSDGFAGMLLDAIADSGCEECLIWAKEDGIVREVVHLGHGPRAGFVLMNETAAARSSGMHKLSRMNGATVVAAHWTMVDAELVRAAKARGLRVYGWTANEQHMVDPLVQAAVAAIVTDDPALVASRVAALRETCGTE